MKNAVVKRTAADLAKIDSVDFQMEMFKKYKLSPLMVETHKFEPRGDNFALVKRDTPVKLFDDCEHGLTIAAVQKTHSERVGLNRGRGKYNDENRLFDADCASIEVKEVAPWFAPC